MTVVNKKLYQYYQFLMEIIIGCLTSLMNQVIPQSLKPSVIQMNESINKSNNQSIIFFSLSITYVISQDVLRSASFLMDRKKSTHSQLGENERWLKFLYLSILHFRNKEQTFLDLFTLFAAIIVDILLFYLRKGRLLLQHFPSQQVQ